MEVGDTLGHHRIVSRLSEGGMATLYLGRAIDAPDAPPVAIKVIHEHLSEDWQFVRMFVDEALISVRLRHPNVVRVDELGEKNNVYYLVMEYVHGCSLAQLLRAMAKQGRRMRPELAVWIAQQVASGLHAAHEMTGHDGGLLGVIHRDVSPQNVLLSVSGEVKLLDFGVAKARGRAERTETGVIKGKLRYMAPEQAIGAEIDRRSDIYALGVVLWEMLTMRRYVEAASDVAILRKVQAPDPVPPSARADGIDPRIDQAVMAAIAPKIDRRPATAAHLYHMLAGAVSPGASPTHVAELLRLFVADEIEATARALPADVAAPIAALARVAVPGAREVGSGRSNVDTLTHRDALDASMFEDPREAEPTASVQRTGPARHSAEITRRAIPPDTQATAPSRPIGAEEDIEELSEAELQEDEPEPRPSLMRFGQGPEEATMEASGDELAAFLVSIRAQSVAAAEPAPLPEWPQPASPAPALAPPLAPPLQRQAPPRAPAGPLRWALRVLLITLLAFVLGAGAAVAWVRLVAG